MSFNTNAATTTGSGTVPGRERPRPDGAPPARRCIVCDGSDRRSLHGARRGSLQRCVCGLVYVDPLPATDVIAAREDEAFHGGLRDETAEMFSAYYRNYPEDPVTRGFRATVQHLKQLTGGGRLIDVGIGTGLMLHLAREAGFEVLGVEISRGAAERARQEFGVDILVGDFERSMLAPGVDAITMADVVEHTRDPRSFLARAVELLRPGGALFVAVPNHRSTVYWTADIVARLPLIARLAERIYVPNHYYYFTPATLARLVGDLGLRVEQVRLESPYLGRYQFSWPVKVGLGTLITLGRLTGLEARVEVYAVKP